MAAKGFALLCVGVCMWGIRISVCVCMCVCVFFFYVCVGVCVCAYDYIQQQYIYSTPHVSICEHKLCLNSVSGRRIQITSSI